MPTNLHDTVTLFETNVALVHEFAKGDSTVVVNGDAGSYPSLAKIAADSQHSLSLLLTSNQGAVDASVLASQQSILAGQQAITQMVADAHATITQILHDTQLALDNNAAALLLSQQALAASIHVSNTTIAKTYYYDPSMSWTIKHNMMTDIFAVTIINLNKDRLYAPITIIDNTEFKVDFTDIEAGSITVQFFF